MPTATVKWLDNKTFVGVDSTKHSVVMSTADAENGVGMKPGDLLLVALAACTAVDLVEILAKKRTPISGLEIAVQGEQDADPPWTYRRIHLNYRLRGAGLTRRSVEQAIRLSEEKYCCVAATVRGVSEITYDFSIEADDELAALPQLQNEKETIP